MPFTKAVLHARVGQEGAVCMHANAPLPMHRTCKQAQQLHWHDSRKVGRHAAGRVEQQAARAPQGLRAAEHVLLQQLQLQLQRVPLSLLLRLRRRRHQLQVLCNGEGREAGRPWRVNAASTAAC